MSLINKFMYACAYVCVWGKAGRASVSFPEENDSNWCYHFLLMCQLKQAEKEEREEGKSKLL